MTRNLYVDIAKLLAGGLTPPEPDVLPFSEAFCLFYSGEFNLIFGDTESGKTWLCLAAIASALNEGGKATIVDLDHNGADSLVGNLIKLGVDTHILEDTSRFRLSEPGDRPDVRALVQDQLVFKPGVVVVDSLGELIPLFRGNSNSADDFTVVHTEVIKPLAKCGAAVLVVDHLAKNADSRAMGPTGTIAKTRAAGGVVVRATAERQFTEGEGGSAKLQIFKDRHSGVRKHYPSDAKPVIGSFELIEADDALTYAFRSSLVSAGHSVRNDTEQLAADLAKLRAAHTVRPTVRQARKVLNCSTRRAQQAVRAFDSGCSNSPDDVATRTAERVERGKAIAASGGFTPQDVRGVPSGFSDNLELLGSLDDTFLEHYTTRGDKVSNAVTCSLTSTPVNVSGHGKEHA